MTLAEFLSRFGGKRKTTPTGQVVLCPAHPDAEPSLSVSDGGDKILLKCFAGCSVGDVCSSLGISAADLFYEPQKRSQVPYTPRRLVCKYDYTDETGVVLYRKLRFEPKNFGWERVTETGTENSLGDVRRVPYRLHELATAKPGDLTWIVEGEKDADNLRAAGAKFVTSSKDWQDGWSSIFAGLRVVVIVDNDTAGEKIARDVTKKLGTLPASVVSMRLPGVGDGGDVSDWLRTGGTHERLARMADARPDSFVASVERAKCEREARLEIAPRILSFGVPYLDHALTGILPTDVVVYSAATGVGKTEAAAITALAVAGSGKRVHMFALEAGPLEIEMRIKYRLIANLYYGDKSRFAHPAIRYQEWAAGLLERSLGRYDEEAQSQFNELAKNLHTYYRNRDFSGSDFVRVAGEVAESTDLIILDHLHYLDSEEENENAGYKKMTKQIRDSALANGKPVLAVAHIRKGDRFSKRLIPTVEDIHGTSDIGKIITKAVMFARAEDQPNASKSISNTYVQVVKNRTDGSVCRFVGMTGFDLRTNTYSPEYEVFKPTDGGAVMSPLTGDETPDWAIGASRSESREATSFARDPLSDD